MSSTSVDKYKMFCPECGERLEVEDHTLDVDGDEHCYTGAECPWCAAEIKVQRLMGYTVYEIRIDGR